MRGVDGVVVAQFLEHRQVKSVILHLIFSRAIVFFRLIVRLISLNYSSAM